MERIKQEPLAGSTPTADSSADQSANGRGGGPLWEKNNHRHTFYLPKDVAAYLDEAVATSGRSKSRVVVDALCEHLGVTRR